jgi:hypothetical protein
MGSYPLAPLSPAARAAYRTALTAHVVEVLHSASPSAHECSLDEIVLAVRAVRPDAHTTEIHRAVAGVEHAGIITTRDGDPNGPWRMVADPRRVPHLMTVCSTPECLRPDSHDGGHLPDLNSDRLSAQLVVNGDDFVAAWAPGSPWVHIYRDARAWGTDEDPTHTLAVPHTAGFTPAVLTDLVTAWASSDHYREPATKYRAFAYEPGVDNGALLYRHADFFAVWYHDRGEVWFYNDATSWDNDIEDPLDRVSVPEDAPFTGAVLDQVCSDWMDRQADR